MANENRTIQKLFSPTDCEWLELDLAENEEEKSKNKGNRDKLHEMLLTALQMPNLIVLAGSGTSLGKVGGPTMWKLWDYCINQNAGKPDNVARERTQKAEQLIKKIKFTGDDNIENLLSLCEAWLQIHPNDSKVKNFIKDSKKIIWDKCTEFLNDANLDNHRTFLRKLSRRNNRNPRLKIFTTNYDLCFEQAAVLQGLISIDGFSFNQPRQFDPLNFTYDIVRRSRTLEENSGYLDGVFHLLKMHGSVNWERNGNRIIEKAKPDPEKACLIYPARGKYQQSYIQPHLELVSQFFASLREPNTCVIVTGFGFNDDHLSEPILAAISSNTVPKLIVVDPTAEDSAKGNKANASRYWRDLYKLSESGADVWLLNADFSQFISFIPDLKTLPQSQKMGQAIINGVKASL